MKKMIALFLMCVLLLLCTVVASADVLPLSKQEMDEFAQRMLELGKSMTPTETKEMNKLYQHRYDQFILCTDTKEINDNTALSFVVMDNLSNVSSAVGDNRLLALNTSLPVLLKTYPNYNESLFGTAEKAVLYMNGTLPEEVSVGYVTRTGQRVQSVVYKVYYPMEDKIRTCQMVYLVQDDAMVKIEALFNTSTMSVEQAQKELEALKIVADSMDASTTITGSQQEMQPFGRDDLIFSGLDYLDLSPQRAIDILGDDYAEEWIEDGETFIHIMQWNAATITFLHDDNRNLLYVDNIFIDEETIEGPRGIRVGDGQEWVTSRFLYNAGNMVDNIIYIYGDEHAEEYATAEYEDMGHVMFRYVYKQEDKVMMMLLEMMDAELKNILIMMQ